MNNLELENSVLRDILKDTLWMARRYAHGRSTYSPMLVNQAIDRALAGHRDRQGHDHRYVCYRWLFWPLGSYD